MINEKAARYGDQYLSQLVQEMNAIPTDTVAEIAAALRDAQVNGKRVYVFGNGGSAATASHMACDLGKNTRQPDQPRLKIVSLSDGIAALTAYGNDEGYENVFSEQLLSLGEAGDVAIAISGSGSSPNVIKAIQVAKDLGMTTIGLTGFQGGKLKGMVDICLVAASNSMQRIEDIHLIINHILTGLLCNPAEYN